ncbi:hypothetical protein Pfo_000671 [Paulownia fortunei]|nr:hypothetical protein Pfo_000671 [Paulownia fortunei]
MGHGEYEKKIIPLLAHFIFKTQIVLITGVCGVAFAIMSKGKTIHSRLKISIDAIESNQCTISKQSRVVELLRTNDKMITIKNVDKLLKYVMENDENFGGKMIVFCEDFRQVLTVVHKATIYQTIFTSLVKSYLLSKMKKKNYFIKEHESRNDPNFSEFLLRFEKCDESSDAKSNNKIPKDIIIEAIFPTLNKNVHSTHYMTSQISKNKNI